MAESILEEVEKVFSHQGMTHNQRCHDGHIIDPNCFAGKARGKTGRKKCPRNRRFVSNTVEGNMVPEYFIQAPSTWEQGEDFVSMYHDLVEKYNSKQHNNSDPLLGECDGSDSTSVSWPGLKDNCNLMNQFVQNTELKEIDGYTSSSPIHFLSGNNNYESPSNCKTSPLRESMNSGILNLEKVDTALAATTSDLALQNVSGCVQGSEVSKNNSLSYVLETAPTSSISNFSTMQFAHPINGSTVASYVPNLCLVGKDISNSNTNQVVWQERVVVTGQPFIQMPLISLDTYKTHQTTPATLETPLSIKITESLNKALERIEPSYLMEMSEPDKQGKQQITGFFKQRRQENLDKQGKQQSLLKQRKEENLDKQGRQQSPLKQRKEENLDKQGKPQSITFSCGVCGVDQLTHLELAIHLSTHNQQSKLQNKLLKKRAVLYQCQYCVKSFMNNSALVRHIRVQHREELKLLPLKRVEGPGSSFKCLYCQKGFLTDSVLANHILTQHNKIKL